MTDQELQSQLGNIIDTIQDGVMLVRPDGRIILVNNAMSVITGFSQSELLGNSCTILDCDACAKSRCDVSKWCKLFAKEREKNRKECHIRRKNGTYIHVLKTAAPLRNEQGQIIAAVETLTDISTLDQKNREIEKLKKLVEDNTSFCGIIGQSAKMQQVYDIIEKAAQSSAPVIIYGESGTGKELAAHAIHQLGPRADKSFVQINCAAFNDALLESEIFGHVKGAFTGAYKHRAGRFEEAAGGDLFLDEVGDIPLPIQIKLLRVLETGTFERVGENTQLELDSRIISATNQNLQELISKKEFREDFFFRINVIPIHLPPLRERRDDIPLLLDHFLKQKDKTSHTITPEAMAALTLHNWPGNIRELKSALEYALVVCDGSTIKREHLPVNIKNAQKQPSDRAVDSTDTCTISDTSIHPPTQKQELINALIKTDGNKSAAAREIGVSRLTIMNRMRKYGIDLKQVITS
ncbi:MAG: sigma-54 interaction domain-containing protein [Desulfovibrio sp.]